MHPPEPAPRPLMNKLLASLTLSCLPLWATAQAPVFEPMPEDSRDAFIGLGLGLAPSYEGSALRRWRSEPLIQIAWSEGAFISGNQAGWHLGSPDSKGWPRWDWGPLLSLQPGRDEDGRRWFVGSPEALGSMEGGPALSAREAGSRLQGMERIATQLHWGGFVNLRLSPQWRLRQTLLSGSGTQGAGSHWRLELQHILPLNLAHHSLALTMGLEWGSARFNQRNYGVNEVETLRSGHELYQPSSGWTTLSAQLRWNWALDPRWLLSSSVQMSRLHGPAAASPLVEQPGAASLSTALVYRF